MTLDQQISGLEAIPTADAEQFRAKASVLSTLRKLKALRGQFEQHKVNEGRVISILLEVLGENPHQRQPSS